MPAFLLPLPHWPLPTGIRRLGTVVLQPKDELHVTLANRALVAELGRCVRGDVLAWLQAAWEAGDTRVLPTGKEWRLHKRPDRAPYREGSWSIVEPVVLPGQEAFLRQLERRLGRQLPRPPAHVTRWVAGRTVGIGLPRAGLLRRYRLAGEREGMPPNSER